VKFPDGTEIELITTGTVCDALTAEYRAHLAKGDGPAFVALFTRSMDEVAQRLESAGRAHQRSGGLLTFQHNIMFPAIAEIIFINYAVLQVSQ